MLLLDRSPIGSANRFIASLDESIGARRDFPAPSSATSGLDHKKRSYSSPTYSGPGNCRIPDATTGTLSLYGASRPDWFSGWLNGLLPFHSLRGSKNSHLELFPRDGSTAVSRKISSQSLTAPRNPPRPRRLVINPASVAQSSPDAAD